MTWNYRIVVHNYDDETYLQIHEVYYDKDGKPKIYNENGAKIGAESIDGIKWALDKMKEAVDKPILSVDDFNSEYRY